MRMPLGPDPLAGHTSLMRANHHHAREGHQQATRLFHRGMSARAWTLDPAKQLVKSHLSKPGKRPRKRRIECSGQRPVSPKFRPTVGLVEAALLRQSWAGRMIQQTDRTQASCATNPALTSFACQRQTSQPSLSRSLFLSPGNKSRSSIVRLGRKGWAPHLGRCKR